jgi:hypothetical protein
MEVGDIVFLLEGSWEPLILQFCGGDYLRLISVRAGFTVEIIEGQWFMGYYALKGGGLLVCCPLFPCTGSHLCGIETI